MTLIAEKTTTTTTNGMAALNTSTTALTDLFFNIGAMRGKDIIPQFTSALSENRELALRIALWSRDARGGAGERQLFRDILNHLENTDVSAAEALANRVGELGRWDDLFVFKTKHMKEFGFELIKQALAAKNGLAAKWTPRKGPISVELRKYLGWSPKHYRKTLVALTSVVETQMCANDWDNINFSHVPSVASARYKKAFNRHTPKFAEYVNALVSGDTSVKVNAGAIYPYDVLSALKGYNVDSTIKNHVIAQWAALPNFVGDANILPLVDVSGSMSCSAGGKNASLTCMDVAVSLGLYLSDKNLGEFKNKFITFHEKPELITLEGDIVQQNQQMLRSKWGMSTNLESAFNLILNLATSCNVRNADMPEILLILSDMQFNQAVTSPSDTAMEMIERAYAAAGYSVPKIVFWNLNASGNVPVTSDKSGAALVSGFSPSIMTSLLSADMSEFTPYGIMIKTIMNERYDHQ
jgi:hypothetical protein